MTKIWKKIVYSIKRIRLVSAAYRNFPLWFVDRLHIMSRKRILYKLRNGINIIAESNTLDCQFISEMFIDEQYTYLSGFEIHPTDTVLDLGAHKGFFSIFAAKHAELGKIISYEASPETYQYLLENLKINNIKNVETFNAAIGLSDGTVNFHIAEDPGCSMIVNDEELHNFLPENIKVVPTVSFYKTIEALSKVDFLKMDIEGMEFSMLMNCPETLLCKVKRIALEYHPESGNVDALAQHLEKVGFKISFWKERRLLYGLREQKVGL